MKTQLEAARDGVVTDPMRRVAEAEGLEPERLRTLIAEGKVVLPYNPIHRPELARGIGKGLRVKVNVNIGTSANRCDLAQERRKLEAAHRYGADAVMDLSTGGDLREIRREILAGCRLPIGTVPAYEAFETARRERGDFTAMTADDLLRTVRRHGEEGVDFVTVHAGLNRDSLRRLERDPRILGMTSRGGSLTARWMRTRDQENPLFERYDELLDIAREHDLTLSLGDALRPGCVQDATDRGQLEELIILGELAQRACAAGVQVMVEGPGHVPLDAVAANVQMQKQLCGGAPFYVLGPVVCDVAPGYDHITSAVGGCLAAFHGADFLCYVTPGEHLRLPTPEDVRDGIVAARIAGFAADLARGRPYASRRNTEMAWARRRLDWARMYELSLDPDKARELHGGEDRHSDGETCTMCGDLCAIKVDGTEIARDSD